MDIVEIAVHNILSNNLMIPEAVLLMKLRLKISPYSFNQYDLLSSSPISCAPDFVPTGLNQYRLGTAIIEITGLPQLIGGGSSY